MPSITVPGRAPRNQEEQQIKRAMIAAHTAILATKEAFPEMHKDAISVGFINSAIQFGCEHADSNQVIADYLRDCADRILAAPLAND